LLTTVRFTPASIPNGILVEAGVFTT